MVNPLSNDTVQVTGTLMIGPNVPLLIYVHPFVNTIAVLSAGDGGSGPPEAQLRFVRASVE